MRCIIYITRQIYFTSLRFRTQNHSLGVLLQDLCLLEAHVTVYPQDLCPTDKKGEELDCALEHLTSDETSYTTSRTGSDRNGIFLQKDWTFFSPTDIIKNQLVFSHHAHHTASGASFDCI